MNIRKMNLTTDFISYIISDLSNFTIHGFGLQRRYHFLKSSSVTPLRCLTSIILLQERSFLSG